jgi:hypothetical protein
VHHGKHDVEPLDDRFRRLGRDEAAAVPEFDLDTVGG